MFKTSITVILMLITGTPWSHSFELAIILPLSGPQAEAGQQVLDGFLLATTEEDSHPDETSDGHLGGLDSHVRKIDSGAGSTEMLNSLDELMQSSELLFVSGLFTAAQAELIAKTLKGENAVLFDPVESEMWRKAQSSPGQLKSMDGGSFSARFQKRYDYSPTPEVIRGYIAARLIAATVRSLSKDELKDREGRMRAVSEAIARFIITPQPLTLIGKAHFC
jgi:ABC-type branched-subunit amino acid transport system substrate-binding protein